MDLDPDFTRSFVICGKMRQILHPYRQLLQEKKADEHQSKMEDFFSPRPSTSQQLAKRPRLTSPTTEVTPPPPTTTTKEEEEVEELGL